MDRVLMIDGELPEELIADAIDDGFDYMRRYPPGTIVYFADSSHRATDGVQTGTISGEIRCDSDGNWTLSVKMPDGRQYVDVDIAHIGKSENDAASKAIARAKLEIRAIQLRIDRLASGLAFCGEDCP